MSFKLAFLVGLFVIASLPASPLRALPIPFRLAHRPLRNTLLLRYLFLLLGDRNGWGRAVISRGRELRQSNLSAAEEEIRFVLDGPRDETSVAKRSGAHVRGLSIEGFDPHWDAFRGRRFRKMIVMGDRH
jgi:hypothetical protein